MIPAAVAPADNRQPAQPAGRTGPDLSPAPSRSSLTALDEAALCELALQGRREAWDVLILRYNHKVVVSLLARGVRIDSARELAQDTWARLVQQQQEGKLTRLCLPSLAITQASFLWLDALRRRVPSGASSHSAAELPDPAAGQEERLLGREQPQRAQAALSRCSASAQRVFRILYENPSISHAEAAAQVGLSVQRVRQILCEVRKVLRLAIEDESQ